MAKRKKKAPKPNAEYALPKVKPASSQATRILALDPGSRNFGISCVSTDGLRVKVLANSVLTNPIASLVEFQNHRLLFRKEIRAWVETFKPNGIIAERFQTRGNGGPLIELVSVMLGSISEMFPKLPIKFTTASTWKNRFNRRFDCDLKEIYPDIHTTPHQFDASLIGIYGLEIGKNVILDYSVPQCIEQVEQSSLLPLKRKRG